MQGERDVSAEGPCGVCDHDPACGYSAINEVWYCHPDEPCQDAPLTCYEVFQALRGAPDA